MDAKIKNKMLEIKIKDNGGGISNEVMPHLFEPYFTTKHASVGTGIGLHMTYNFIVDGMKGKITANNTTYKYENKNYTGACFTILIPCV